MTKPVPLWPAWFDSTTPAVIVAFSASYRVPVGGGSPYGTPLIVTPCSTTSLALLICGFGVSIRVNVLLVRCRWVSGLASRPVIFTAYGESSMVSPSRWMLRTTGLTIGPKPGPVRLYLRVWSMN